MSSRAPDFFIVGAPKCGTTALDQYLSAHPRIFMAHQKESHHFAPDLTAPGDKYRSERAYAELFRGAGDAERVGESSVMYLYSRVAAERIFKANPDARIIAMVRDPVTMIPSLHSQNIFNHHEKEPDLERALAAEPYRRAHLQHRRSLRIPHRVLYREVADYAPQLERYFRVFGQKRVHVIVYEEFSADPAREYRRVLEFLGVDATFQPTFEVVNPNKVPRSQAIAALLNRPPPWVRRVWRRLHVPAPVDRALRSQLVNLNAREKPRQPIDPEVAARLRREMQGPVRALERTLGRDLGRWWKTARSVDRSTSDHWANGSA